MPHPFDLQFRLPNNVRLKVKLWRFSIWMLLQPRIILLQVNLTYYLYVPLCEHNQPLFFTWNYIPISRLYRQNSNHVVLYVYFNRYVFLVSLLMGFIARVITYWYVLQIMFEIIIEIKRICICTYKPSRSVLNKLNIVISTIIKQLEFQFYILHTVRIPKFNTSTNKCI
jgi:hypothetical protein